MLDIRFVRENKEVVREALLKRHSNFNLEHLLELDSSRRSILAEVEGLRSQQHKASEDIARGSDKEKEAALMAMRSLKEILQKKEEELKKIEAEFEKLMLLLPNIPDPSVPEGRGEEDNVEIRRWGNNEDFLFEPKSHLELMKNLDLADLERGAKVSGFRGYFLKNEGALLSMALWNFAMDFMVKKGFVPFISPALVKEASFVGTGKLPQFREEIYGTEDQLYLAATAEIPMMGYHSDEVLLEDELPKKYVAFSPCYRREAGSYGKDVKGLFRLHEFMKVEQVVLCKAEYQESVKWHEELTRYSEEMVQALELPYRVLFLSSGDMPPTQVKSYDIECWIPSEKRYRETHSSSILNDFQSRRLKIRYKGKDGKLRYVHSLNNTAIATPRLLHSLLENHQREDGSVSVPAPLVKYLGKDIISRKSD